MKHSEQIKKFLDYLAEIETQLNIQEALVKEADNKRLDILHRLELNDDSYHDAAHMSLALRSISRERRAAKNERELLIPIFDWIRANKKTVSSLQQLLGNVRKIERIQQDRLYADRTDIIKEIMSEE